MARVRERAIDHKTVLGIIAVLITMSVSGGLKLYGDFNTISDKVEHLQRDIDLRDLRERGMRDSLIRLEERHSALAEGGCRRGAP